MSDMDIDRHLRCKIADLTEECKTIRAQLGNTHRALVLEVQQHQRSHAEVLRLAERLRKYEPGRPMHLA